jgi:hypothetical protein
MSCFKCYGSEKDVKPPKRAEVNIKKSADDQRRPADTANQLPKALSGMILFYIFLVFTSSRILRACDGEFNSSNYR